MEFIFQHKLDSQKAKAWLLASPSIKSSYFIRRIADVFHRIYGRTSREKSTVFEIGISQLRGPFLKIAAFSDVWISSLEIPQSRNTTMGV